MARTEAKNLKCELLSRRLRRGTIIGTLNVRSRRLGSLRFQNRRLRGRLLGNGQADRRGHPAITILVHVLDFGRVGLNCCSSVERQLKAVCEVNVQCKDGQAYQEALPR